MTRQYKSMQEELMRRINTLETTIMEQKDQLDLARQVAGGKPPLFDPRQLACRTVPLGCSCRSSCSCNGKPGLLR